MSDLYREIYRSYQGNRISEKLTVFHNGEKYKFLFQKYDRTQPTRADKANGVKAERILIYENEVYFTSLSNIDHSLLPFPKLVEDFRRTYTDKSAAQQTK